MDVSHGYGWLCLGCLHLRTLLPGRESLVVLLPYPYSLPKVPRKVGRVL